MKIVCYGDSNTYGWDPAFFSGNHYEWPWPELLETMTGQTVVNLGYPGRTIPSRPNMMDWFVNGVKKEAPDLLLIMLGTNDVLDMPCEERKKMADMLEMINCNKAEKENISAHIKFSEPAFFMNKMIKKAVSDNLAKNILLISPAQIELHGKTYEVAMKFLSKEFEIIAHENGTEFVDAAEWKIPMAFDGVHFTEDGHKIFAEKIRGCIASKWNALQ